MKFFLVAVSLFFTASSMAQLPGDIHLWPSSRLIDTANGAKLVQHDATGDSDRLIGGRRVIRLTDVYNPTIRLYPAKNPNGTAVLVCPGGGYAVLAEDLEGTELCAWFNSIGVTAILLTYRVPVPAGRRMYDLPLQDAQRALRLVKFNAKKWNVRIGHIGVMGFSAGAHLCTTLSAKDSLSTYKPLDAADSLSARPDFAILIYPAFLKNDKDSTRLAEEVQVTKTTPPTFIVQTEDDPVDVQNSLVYYSALKKFNVPAELHLFPNGGHGYGRRVTGAGLGEYPALLAQWLKDK